jgi:hypothetical protein
MGYQEFYLTGHSTGANKISENFLVIVIIFSLIYRKKRRNILQRL